MKDTQKAELFRKLFAGRSDVYGKQVINKDGIRNFYPQCENIWTDGCHIKLKDGKHCSECGIKKYIPVSNSTVLKHIRGDEQQIVYTLLENGNVRFCAADFDYKEGKEDKGYTFPDVQAFQKALTDLGVHCYIARSTGRGFHAYIFFDGEIAAAKARAIIIEGFERAGFMEYSRNGIKPIPEIFPKQTTAGNNGIGNGIKPPMIESNFERERNCWVTSDNAMIPASVQWDYLSKVTLNKVEDIEKIIKDNEIPVLELASGGGSRSYGDHAGGTKRTGKWQAPLSGSYEKVLEGCAAIRSLMAKIEGGYIPRHDEGFALYHLAMNTADGLPIFKQKTRGWGDTDADQKQLEHSLAKNYAPWTCRALQEKGICPHGTKCFEKKPPVAMVDGQEVVRDDLPQDQWPEPSPIRYAFSKGDDFLAKLQKEAEALADEKDLSIKMQRLKALIFRAMVFDEAQQDLLKGFIVEKKIAKKGDIAKLFRTADKEKSEELRNATKDNENIVIHNDVTLQRTSDGGYAVIRSIKGEGTQVSRISNFQIQITEDRVYVDADKPNRRMLYGHVKFPGFEQQFEINSDVWAETSDFVKFFMKLCGTLFNVTKNNVELIRQAAIEFSRRDGIVRSSFFLTQGWYGQTYLMPSVIIDADGIKPNTEKPIDLSGKAVAKQLDFKIISDSEFKDTMFHIKTELFKAFPEKPLFISLAHFMQSAIVQPLGFPYKPTLWIEGQSGSGKSTMMKTLMDFWGEFHAFPNWQGTAKGNADHAHQFKDAVLYIDDYKNSDQQARTAKDLVQYSYDQSVRSRLSKEGEQKADNPCRALLATSGEHAPASESSVIARMIILDYPQEHTKQSKHLLTKIDEMKHLYRGVTPRFIHFFLTRDKKILQSRIRELSNQIEDACEAFNNRSRIAANLAWNTLAWELFIDFFIDSGIMDHKEAKEYKEKHYNYILDTLRYLKFRCEDERIGNILIQMMVEGLDSGALRIKNLQGYDDNPHGIEIGVVKKDDTVEPDLVYLHFRTITQWINDKGKNQGVVGNATSFGAQLKELGIIVKYDKDRVEKNVMIDGLQRRYWVASLAKLNLVKTNGKPTIVGGTQPLPISEPVAPQDMIV